MRLGKMSSLKNLLLRAKRAAKVETFLQKKSSNIKNFYNTSQERKQTFKNFFIIFFFCKNKNVYKN